MAEKQVPRSTVQSAHQASPAAMPLETPAPAGHPATVTVSAQQWADMQTRLAALELMARTQLELQINPQTRVLDRAYEDWKAEASRPAKDRTQDIVDKRWGKTSPRFVCRLDSSQDGKPGPNISEHFPLELSAASEHEASARYLDAMGIKKHDYVLQVSPVPA